MANTLLPTAILLLALALASSGRAEAAPLVIAEGGRSDYVIVVADDASPSTRHGAAELQAFLKQMTGVELPLRNDAGPLAPREIMVGDSAHLRALGLDVDYEALGPEGYVLRTVGPHLVITGGALRGAMYGVYGLLEDHLGCRWFTPTVSHIPTYERLLIGPLDETKVPLLEYREPFVIDCFDGDWNARNRMNGNSARLEEKHGGKVTYVGFSHTFFNFISPREYFDEHPEYFSEIDGVRVRDHTQLCCTNEDVIRLLTEKLRRLMRDHPEGDVFSVTQMDWGNYCQCPDCAALIAAEGTPGAPLFAMINRLAEALADEFPDKAIDTFAYQWSRKPPKTIRPHPNVIIRLCSIECCFSHPLATCDSDATAPFRDDIARWAEISDRLWVWDYVTCFTNYLLPFPNLRVLDHNIRFFLQHNVTGIFEEGNYQSLHGEFQPLRGYLMAKFLWDPDYGYERALEEFLHGVYGDAAPYLRRYIDLLHDKVERENIHIHIWEQPDAPYLTDQLLSQADDLWAQAEAAVADQPDVLARVQAARLSVDYALLERGKQAALGPYRLEPGRYRPHYAPDFAARLDRFFDIAEREGVSLVSEWRRESLSAYRERLLQPTRGHEMVALENRSLRISAVPALGGRLVEIRSLPEGPNLCALPPEAPGYPNAGGYAEWRGADPHGPGWDLEYDALVKQAPGGGGKLSLSSVVEGRARIERTIELPRRGPSVRITSTLRSLAPTTAPADLHTSLSLDLGPPAQVELELPGRPRQALGEQPLTLSADTLAAGLTLHSPARGLSLRLTASGEMLAGAAVRADAGGATAVELAMDGRLAPGAGASLSQQIEVLPPPG